MAPLWRDNYWDNLDNLSYRFACFVYLCDYLYVQFNVLWYTLIYYVADVKSLLDVYFLYPEAWITWDSTSLVPCCVYWRLSQFPIYDGLAGPESIRNTPNKLTLWAVSHTNRIRLSLSKPSAKFNIKFFAKRICHDKPWARVDFFRSSGTSLASSQSAHTTIHFICELKCDVLAALQLPHSIPLPFSQCLQQKYLEGQC